jgi:type IV pilus assembly protein PilQ
MRLKQLLVLILTLGFFSAAGYASAPQLSQISVAPQGNATVVTLHVSGAFTHNEYRLADDLLLIDLIGVAANVDPNSRSVQAFGLSSYSVDGCPSAKPGSNACPGGVRTARVKLSLLANPEVRVNSGHDGLVVELVPAVAANVTGSALPQDSSPATSEPAAAAASSPAADTASSRPIEVRNVAVIQGTKGAFTTVEVTANGPIQTRTMKLKSPDRIVVDLMNSVPAERPKTVAVNAKGVLAVRMGRFQADPPITRLVVDLSEACVFELANRGNKLLIEIRPVASTEPSPASPSASPMVTASYDSTRQPEQPASVAPAEAAATPQKDESGSVAADVPAAQPKPGKAVAKQVAPAVEAEPAQNNPPAAPAKAFVLATPVEQVPEPKTAMAAPATAEPGNKSGAAPAQDFVVLQPQVQEHVSEKNPEQTQMMAMNGNAPVATPGTSAPQNAAPEAASANPPSQAGVNFAAEQRHQAPSAPSAPRYTGEPISVNLKDVDLKDFFRLIHEISGLNIVLDPNVNGSLTLVLDDVPWDQALDIVLKNNNLDRQLDGNVLRIATVDTLRLEAESHRHQMEAQMAALEKVTATRFLSYAHAKDVLPTIKRVLSPRGDIVADERTNGLIITDVPTVIPEIDKLLAQLDRKTQEVEIEARVIAATRSFARDIGTQLGMGWGNSPTAVGGSGAVGNSPNQVGYLTAPPYFTSPLVTTSSSTATGAAIPLFSSFPAASPTSGLSLLNIGSAYRIDSVLTAAESRGLLKVLSRPRVITQNNIQAVIKQGQRVPITTQAQLNGPPTVVYVDAVLRLTVTPQITIENTIFLNVDIENTTPDYSNEIQGNPVFLTQQATTQVLVTNGGTVVIGGVLQTSNSLNIQQVPFLGSVPMLGNLFKRRAVNTSTQELIFFITPRILET